MRIFFVLLLTSCLGCRSLPCIEVAVNCGPGKPTVTVAVGESQPAAAFP